MASNFECVGLPVTDMDELDRLLGDVLPTAVEIGQVGDVVVKRWQDPTGSRLTMATSSAGKVLDLLPSFAGRRGAQLDVVTFVSEDLATADVVDENGEKATAMTIAVEEWRLLQPTAP